MGHKTDNLHLLDFQGDFAAKLFALGQAHKNFTFISSITFPNLSRISLTSLEFL